MGPDGTRCFESSSLIAAEAGRAVILDRVSVRGRPMGDFGVWGFQGGLTSWLRGIGLGVFGPDEGQRHREQIPHRALGAFGRQEREASSGLED